jgi:hypothetical protein
MFVHASLRQRQERASLKAMGEMAKKLEITDLNLFTEANYTRHLSQADLHAPFQDGPLSQDHFPSGALAGPPLTLKRMNEKLD